MVDVTDWAKNSFGFTEFSGKAEIFACHQSSVSVLLLACRYTCVRPPVGLQLTYDILA